MATSNPTPQQRQKTFEMIEPLFYEDLNKVEPILSLWTLEKIPRNVNTKQIAKSKKKTHNGWLYKNYNTKGKFRCTKCIKNGINEDEATWSSGYTTVLVRGYFGPDTDEYGDTWLGGWVQIKIFTQACTRCGQYIPCELSNERVDLLVKWLHRWIANNFHGFNLPGYGYHGKRPTTDHLKNDCEACAEGWCGFLGIKE